MITLAAALVFGCLGLSQLEGSLGHTYPFDVRRSECGKIDPHSSEIIAILPFEYYFKKGLLLRDEGMQHSGPAMVEVLKSQLARPLDLHAALGTNDLLDISGEYLQRLPTMNSYWRAIPDFTFMKDNFGWCSARICQRYLKCKFRGDTLRAETKCSGFGVQIGPQFSFSRFSTDNNSFNSSIGGEISVIGGIDGRIGGFSRIINSESQPEQSKNADSYLDVIKRDGFIRSSRHAPLLMLWTAPAPARECHESGCC